MTDIGNGFYFSQRIGFGLCGEVSFWFRAWCKHSLDHAQKRGWVLADHSAMWWRSEDSVWEFEPTTESLVGRFNREVFGCPNEKNRPYAPPSVRYLLLDSTPVRLAPYRLAPPEMKFLREHFQQLRRDGVIEPSCSHFSIPMFLDPKPGGSYRAVVIFTPSINVLRLNRCHTRCPLGLPLVCQAQVLHDLGLKPGLS
jgi:hypothetical protein